MNFADRIADWITDSERDQHVSFTFDTGNIPTS